MGGYRRISHESGEFTVGAKGCALSTPTVASARGDAPTVVLITTDTHRFDHMAFNEAGVDVETPVQDALAARGVVFTDCFAPVNVTNPSHVALMTGESVLVTGVRSNFSRLSDAAP